MKKDKVPFLLLLLLLFVFSNCEDDGARPYRTYSSLISQEGESDPTEKILINELGISIEWSRNATGVFRGALSKPMDTDKTSLIIELSQYDRIPTGGFINPYTIEFYSCDRFNVYDSRDGLSNAVIEIKTFN